ncbi:MAG: amino acid adenylation domain-containing protein, partial [Gemmatimonadetes bacterium]|nr:amino acid adenylation domain-containing protein [Gemmatimonadota bacterium]
RPQQVVREAVELEFRREDRPGWGAAELEAFAAEERARGFDPARPPLMRVALVRTGEREHQLVWTHHHLVLDGWSLSVLFRDMLALYRAHARGEAPRLAEPPRYREYVAWLETRDPAAAERHWREELSGFAAATPLPLPRPAAGEVRHAEHRAELSEELSRALREQARERGLTVNTLVQGAWALLLARYAGEDDVVFGATVSGRPAELPGADEMVGLFINTLPVRVLLPPQAEVGSWLAELQERQARAREHEYTSLVQVQRWSEVPRGQALFESIVVFENFPVERAGAEDEDELRVRRALSVEQPNYPLTLIVTPGPRFHLSLHYDRGRGDPDDAARLVEQLGTLLEGMTADPGRRLFEVSLLRDAERARMLTAWNGAAAAGPPLLHDLFAAQAARTPDRPAVVAEGRSLTYGELERRANRLAGRLRRMGVGPEVAVGVCMERSPELVLAFLAILKAGGAYLPLDPAYPAERLAFMLADAGARVLLSGAGAADPIPAFTGERLALTLEPDPAGESGEPPACAASRDNAAYVIYTSGSTGTPKGVVVTHASATNLLSRSVEILDVRPGGRVLQTSAVGFDVSVLDVFAALLFGSALYFADREALLAPERLVALLREREIATWMVTPALLETLPEVDLPALRTLVVGGDRCSARAAGAWSAGRRMVNIYGPTECTIFATSYTCPPGVAESPPIGWPAADARVYVLDAWGEPVAGGVPGELYIGGSGVARGYLGRPELTAEKFLPDPFAAEPGARMYRTGDRVRGLASGALEFLGRLDSQVKIRGQRVEPGEVEGVLLRGEGVREAVVVAREDVPGEKRLVAYVVGEAGASPNAAGLRAYLRDRLPEHMVPSAFVVLDRFPLSANGKVDRRALPAPGESAPGEYVAPRTAAEEVLCGIWSEVLGVERVGVHDDFFELGGHSLVANRVVSRVAEALGVDLPIRLVFEAPTVARLAGSVEAARRAGADGAAPPIARAPRDGAAGLPLSFAQRRLWLIDRLEPGSPAYNMAYALRLRGSLDVGALRGALDELVRRHEALRTVFTERDGEPAQVVREVGRAHLPAVDLRRLPDPEPAARRLAAEEGLRPFDLARGPLLRTLLLRLAGDDHVLCFTMHHVVSDGWSMEVLVREVSALYTAFRRGEPSPLPELPVQYADYAVWQRGWLDGAALDAQVGYWKERLAGAPPLLEIPTDRPRRAGVGARAGGYAFTLSDGAVRGLRELARREGATLFMTVLAGWQALLGRWAGQDDVVVGSAVAGRTRHEVEGLIGFFVNMLVLRADLSGDPTWTGLLGRVRATVLGAFDHQDIPFERLVEELGVERSLTHTPVFQAAFALSHGDGSGGLPRLGEVEPEPFLGGGGVSKFDLDLAVADDGTALRGTLVYRAALFEAATIERMAGHLQVVLEALAAGPGRRLSELSLLREGERAQLVAGSRTPAGELPRECVHELVARQAARTPDSVAVSAESGSLTFAELERAAGRLASHLRALGVGPEARVGVCLERGVDLVVAVLGVLKAGGAYVPLDPAYPAERLAYTLADSGAAVLLTASPAARGLPPFAGRIVRLDEEREAIDAAPEWASASGVEMRNAAYVVYTSGSTGRPKGVVVEHSGFVSILLAMRDTFGLGAGEVFPVLASCAFDIWAFEVFAPLLAGGEVRLLGRDTVRDVERLVEELERVDAVDAVPALMREIVQRVQAGPGTLPGVRHAFVGGDAIPPDLLEQMRSAFPSARVWALYGPTETTIVCSATPLRPGERPGWQRLGRPLPGAAMYVVDAWGNLLPDGLPGEVWIGGAGVARGYLGRPELTAERFVSDGFGGEAGARLYRSGDRGRRRPDGELEFLGRIDQQVKVRGFRIEPGEVEAALLEIPAVREAVVAVREDAPGRKRLVAYVVPEEGAELPAGELRARLAARLPEHMVPGAFVMLERLPLNANGKVDRRALPAPEQGSDAEYVAPRTATEEVLSGIWAEVLRLERVGTGDNFFELGGHSLLATQVVSRMRQAFGTEVPLRALFEAPTVAALARRVEELRSDGAPAAPPIVRVPRDGEPLPLSFAQQRLWVVDRIEPGSPAYNLPNVLRLRGALDVAALRAALDALVARHETLRTVFAEHDGVPVQVVHASLPVPLPVVDLRGLPEPARRAEAESLARADAVRPFDLARGPLLRAALLRLDDESHVLCFTMHHVVSDAWSMEVLTREVFALYAAAVRGEAAKLPELPVQYADYAVWQREWFRGEILDEQIGYWKERLAGAPPLIAIPTDRPRSARPSPRAGSHRFRLAPELSDGLRALSRREGGTLFMTLLAAWQSLLGRYAGGEDVVVGTPVAGRTRREVEGLIGFFVNMLPLRVDLGGNPTWSELLGRVREAALGAYTHQELPFERLVDELNVERSLTHTPVFQVLFALDRVGGGEERPAPGGVELEPFAGGTGATKYDLNLTVLDGGEALAGMLAYRAGLYDAGTAARIAGHLERVLGAMAAGLRLRASEASLLSDAESAHLLRIGAGAATDAAGQACIHDLVRAQVARTPDAPALDSGEEGLTYAELFRRASRLANLLRREGVGPEVRVGISMEPAPEAVIAVLGVLLAGGAYLPLDPELPAERREYVLRDAAPVLLLTQAALAGRLEGTGVPLLRVDAEAGRIGGESPEPPAVTVDPDNLAYVIYTSGSTGQPKGVLVPHRGAVNAIRAFAGAYRIGAGARVLLFAPLHFDASVLDLFTALCFGAELVVGRREETLPGEALTRFLRDRRVTHAKFTPSALAATPPAELPELEAVMSGGEACGAEVVARWAPGRRFYNGYGPTETSVRVTVVETSDPTLPPPIGRAVENVRLYVLDAWLNPVPVGIPGELYVGGVQVARGYLGRPDSTATVFLPDPFSGEAGARMYRTGDRVRWRA